MIWEGLRVRLLTRNGGMGVVESHCKLWTEPGVVAMTTQAFFQQLRQFLTLMTLSHFTILCVANSVIPSFFFYSGSHLIPLTYTMPALPTNWELNSPSYWQSSQRRPKKLTEIKLNIFRYVSLEPIGFADWTTKKQKQHAPCGKT